MNEKYKFRPASRQEITLYCFLGEAVCAVQHLEDALRHSIVLKMTKPRLKSEADQLLEKHRSYTLGKAITIARKARLYPEQLHKILDAFLLERNWLIHKSIAQSRDEWDLNISREKLINRIKTIAKQAHNIILLIEKDLIEFSEDSGVDISRIKAEMNKQ